MLTRAPELQPEVHEQIDVVRILFVGLFQQAEIPLNLVPALDHLGLVSVMEESGVSEAVLHRPFLAVQFQAGIHLFMDAAHVELLGSIAEEAGHLAYPLIFPAHIHQGQTIGDGVGLREQGSQVRVVRLRDFFIGIKDEDPVSAGMEQGGIAGGAEVVVPGTEVDFSSVGAGDLDSPVGRAGVYEDDLVGEASDGFEASIEESFLVLGDEAHR